MFAVNDKGSIYEVDVFIVKKLNKAFPVSSNSRYENGVVVYDLNEVFATRSEAIDCSNKIVVGYQIGYKDDIMKVGMRLYRGKLRAMDENGYVRSHRESFIRLEDALAKALENVNEEHDRYEEYRQKALKKSLALKKKYASVLRRSKGKKLPPSQQFPTTWAYVDHVQQEKEAAKPKPPRKKRPTAAQKRAISEAIAEEIDAP